MSGWFRLYVVVATVWVGWFGYEIYNANKQRNVALDFLQTYKLDRDQGRASAYNGQELGEWAGEQLARRNFAVKALPVAPIGLPIVYWFSLWVFAGFKRKGRPPSIEGSHLVASKEYLSDLNRHLSYLYAFARRTNELDFAISLAGEFRGAQDAGWATTITAQEVYDEITAHSKTQKRSKAELRVVLMLYCQLAEAGGIYESLKNILGVMTATPYALWPFRDLVRVKQKSSRVIGPNANATFRNLATSAKAVGLVRLSELFEDAFMDDLRNGISHADYVIWTDGVRLPGRNGGYAKKLSFPDVNEALTRATGFFQILTEYNRAGMLSFDPPKKIVGRFSANPPMPWTVYCDPKTGAFGITGSSPGSMTTPEYNRQVAINGFLGGKVLALFSAAQNEFAKQIEDHISAAGFEPNSVGMSEGQLSSLIEEIENQNLWDVRQPHAEIGEVLLASPWGFKWVLSTSDFDNILSEPDLDFQLS